MDIDSSVCTDCEEFHQPHFILLNIAIGGGFTNSRNSSGCSSSSSAGSHSHSGSAGGCARKPEEITAEFPATMIVDWVRLYHNGFTSIVRPSTPTPTISPMINPSLAGPSVMPSGLPSLLQKETPSKTPSSVASSNPTYVPTSIPSAQPSLNSSSSPTSGPTRTPPNPSYEPPSKAPVIPTGPHGPLDPSMRPTCSPVRIPSRRRSETPTLSPSQMPNTIRSNVVSTVSNATCTEQSRTDNFRCPAYSVFCVGLGLEYEFAEGSSLSLGGNDLLAGIVYCIASDTSHTLIRVHVQELFPRRVYTFKVIGVDYAITAVNLQSIDRQSFCTWKEDAVVETDVLLTPISNETNELSDLDRLAICVERVDKSMFPTASPIQSSKVPSRNIGPSFDAPFVAVRSTRSPSNSPRSDALHASSQNPSSLNPKRYPRIKPSKPPMRKSKGMKNKNYEVKSKGSPPMEKPSEGEGKRTSLKKYSEKKQSKGGSSRGMQVKVPNKNDKFSEKDASRNSKLKEKNQSNTKEPLKDKSSGKGTSKKKLQTSQRKSSKDHRKGKGKGNKEKRNLVFSVNHYKAMTSSVLIEEQKSGAKPARIAVWALITTFSIPAIVHCIFI